VTNGEDVGSPWHDAGVALLAVVLVGFVLLVAAAVLLSLTDRGLEPEPLDHRDLGLPDRPLVAADVPGLRFRIGLRGYRMDDVDAALYRLAQALHEAETRAGH
jgi:DivIVA domain-containing protein